MTVYGLYYIHAALGKSASDLLQNVVSNDLTPKQIFPIMVDAGLKLDWTKPDWAKLHLNQGDLTKMPTRTSAERVLRNQTTWKGMEMEGDGK